MVLFGFGFCGHEAIAVFGDSLPFDGVIFGVAFTDKRLVDHSIAHPDVGEYSSVWVAGDAIELDAYGFSFNQVAIHFIRPGAPLFS